MYISILSKEKASIVLPELLLQSSESRRPTIFQSAGWSWGPAGMSATTASLQWDQLSQVNYNGSFVAKLTSYKLLWWFMFAVESVHCASICFTDNTFYIAAVVCLMKLLLL